MVGMIDMETYILLALLGAFLILSKDVLDIDLLGGYNISSVIASAIFMWGVVGLFGVPEPYAGLIGGLVFGLLTHIFLSAVIVQTDIEKEYTGKYGKVNMEIDPDSKGKIKVVTDKTVEFFIATNAEPISKPLKQGTPVQIVEFDGIVAKVRPVDRMRENVHVKSSYGLLGSIYLFLKNISRKDLPTCEICYHTVEKKSQIKTCPHCEATFHATHWKQWIEINQYCPICRENI